MCSGDEIQRPCKSAASLLWLGRILALLLVLLPANGFAQQSASSHGDSQKSRQISLLLQEAEDLLRQGSVDEAKKKVEEELAKNPASLEGYNLLGIIYTDQKDFVNALNAYDKALELNAKSTRTLNNLGSLYIAQNKLDLAEKEFKKVLLLEAGNRDANYNLGLLLMAGVRLQRPFRASSAFLPGRRNTLQLDSCLPASGQNDGGVEIG